MMTRSKGEIIKALKNPRTILGRINHRYPKLFSWMDDETALKFWYKYYFHKKLNLDNPQTFNEKLQWLKLNDRKPIYTTMVDKYQVKNYVASIIGGGYIIPTLGVWDNYDDIDFDSLPNQFVLKCTHDSGGLVICKDKSSFDKKAARRKISHSLRRNYYWVGREWPYKDVKPRIIAEKYMVDESGQEIKDYKLWCFNGKPEFTLVCSERYSETGICEDFYDMNWVRLPIGRPRTLSCGFTIAKPRQYELMKEFAGKLSQGLKFARVDFYEIRGNLYFGEITFYPAGGFCGFEPERLDKDLGQLVGNIV